MVYKYLGYGVTDENGVAKLDHDANGDPLDHSYTGVGAGEVDVLASLDKPIVDGSIVSVPCSVLDCLIYDSGVIGTKNTNVVIGSDLEETVGNNFTRVSSVNTTDFNGCSYKYSRTTLTGDFEILLTTNDMSYARIGLSSLNNSKSYRVLTSRDSITFWKIRRVDGVITTQISTNGTDWSTISQQVELNTLTTEECYFLFYIYNSSDIPRYVEFKDLKIYNI